MNPTPWGINWSRPCTTTHGRGSTQARTWELVGMLLATSILDAANIVPRHLSLKLNIARYPKQWLINIDIVASICVCVIGCCGHNICVVWVLWPTYICFMGAVASIYVFYECCDQHICVLWVLWPAYLCVMGVVANIYAFAGSVMASIYVLWV